VLYWNPASEALYGVAAADVLGRIPLGALYADELELQGLLDVIRTIEANGKAYGPYEVDITRQDGRIVSVLATTFPIPTGEGRTAFVCMDVDITARKQAERDLQELNQSLESRVEARTRELSQGAERSQPHPAGPHPVREAGPRSAPWWRAWRTN
jgi:PAS domain S-box-containing protein